MKNFKSKIIGVAIFTLVVVLCFASAAVYADITGKEIDDIELSDNLIVDISEYDKFSLELDLIQEHNDQYQEEIMTIHKDFIRQIVELGYLSRIDHMIYERKLAKYHIESRIGISDKRFEDAFKMHYTSMEIERYRTIDIYGSDIIYIDAYLATNGGCIEGLGGLVRFSVKDDSFTLLVPGDEVMDYLNNN
ncbi:MAG: hypothetical protein JEZ08_16375 [Clostridiales bacterium]|nr:hypothetical protein [Clostridiales bacterium]